MNPLLSPDGRRAAAFGAVLGGCIIMTVYAFLVLWLVRSRLDYAFWLGICAHVQIIVGITGLLALLVKRSIKASRDGIEITDDAIKDGDSVIVSKDVSQ